MISLAAHSKCHRDSTSSDSGKLLVCLNPDESSATFRSSNAGGAGTAEGVDDEIAGLAGTEHDWADECQWELGGEVRKSLTAVFDETGDAPDVVPKFAVRAGS